VTLKLLSYNIRYGGTGRERLIAGVIRSAAPEVVLLQEATRPRVVEQLAAQTGMRVWAAQPGHSLAFMSRLDVSGYQWHHPLGTRRPFLEVAMGNSFRIFGVHLTAAHSNWTERWRVLELKGLLRGIRHYRDVFHVLAGDFNTLAPGEHLDVSRLPMRLRALVWLSGGKIRWQTIQLLLDAHYIDGYRMKHSDPGYTFPTWSPQIRLDFVFLPSHCTERLKSCAVVTGAPAVSDASDHLPLLFELET
jgi:exodeoxyribonuclease-3